MQIALVEGFNPYSLCLSVVAAKSYPDKSMKVRFIGSAVMLDIHNNKILTCAHLLDSLNEDETLHVCSGNSQKIYELIEIKRHPSIDLLIAKINTNDQIISLLNVKDQLGVSSPIELGMGLPVRAYGYTSESPNASVPQLTIEMRQGIVTLSSLSNDRVKNIGGNSRRELSFSIPCGFSGGPLLIVNNGPDQGLIFVGILYNNIESRIAAWEHFDIVDGNQQYRETGYKIEEHALAHSLEDIKQVIIDLEGKI